MCIGVCDGSDCLGKLTLSTCILIVEMDKGQFVLMFSFAYRAVCVVILLYRVVFMLVSILTRWTRVPAALHDLEAACPAPACDRAHRHDTHESYFELR